MLATAPFLCFGISYAMPASSGRATDDRRRNPREALINSATHLRTSALSSRRRQILDVAPLRLRLVSSIDTAHLCKSGRPHFISASLLLICASNWRSCC